jgi:hypothetical protein
MVTCWFTCAIHDLMLGDSGPVLLPEVLSTCPIAQCIRGLPEQLRFEHYGVHAVGHSLSTACLVSP